MFFLYSVLGYKLKPVPLVMPVTGSSLKGAVRLYETVVAGGCLCHQSVINRDLGGVGITWVIQSLSLNALTISDYRTAGEKNWTFYKAQPHLGCCFGLSGSYKYISILETHFLGLCLGGWKARRQQWQYTRNHKPPEIFWNALHLAAPSQQESPDMVCCVWFPMQREKVKRPKVIQFSLEGCRKTLLQHFRGWNRRAKTSACVCCRSLAQLSPPAAARHSCGLQHHCGSNGLSPGSWGQGWDGVFAAWGWQVHVSPTSGDQLPWASVRWGQWAARALPPADSNLLSSSQSHSSNSSPWLLLQHLLPLNIISSAALLPPSVSTCSFCCISFCLQLCSTLLPTLPPCVETHISIPCPCLSCPPLLHISSHKAAVASLHHLPPSLQPPRQGGETHPHLTPPQLLDHQGRGSTAACCPLVPLLHIPLLPLSLESVCILVL